MTLRMFRSNHWSLLAASAALLPVLAGCQSTQKEQAPAPVVVKPQPKAEPKAEPKPVVSAGAVSMAFPTGDPSTSAVLLEKFVPSTVVMGQNFTYEIRVKNLTGMSLENVVVSEQMSPNFKVANQSPQPNMVGMVANYTFKNIPPKGSETIKITGAPNAKDSISCCASVTYNQMLCAQTNVIQPALKVAAAAPAEVLICDEFPVEFTVTNPGDGSTADVKVMATLPQGLVAKNGSSQVALDAGVLKPGESRKVAVMAKASKTGSYANAAKATAANNLSADSNTVTTVVRQPVLAVACNAPAERYIGRKATYDFTVTNKSDMQSQNTVIEASVPAGVQVSEISDNGKQSGGMVRWDLGTLAAGDEEAVAGLQLHGGRQVHDDDQRQGAVRRAGQLPVADRVEGYPGRAARSGRQPGPGRGRRSDDLHDRRDQPGLGPGDERQGRGLPAGLGRLCLFAGPDGRHGRRLDDHVRSGGRARGRWTRAIQGRGQGPEPRGRAHPRHDELRPAHG